MKSATINQLTGKQQQIFDFLNDLSKQIDTNDFLYNYIDLEDLEDMGPSEVYDHIYDAVSEGNGFDCEVIYYSNAIQYLQENDPSLKESLEIAADYGFELQNLSSEVLASLLKSQNVRNDFADLQSEIEEFFNNLD